MNRLILVSGGIGAGKSVVCKALSAMGYPVYDCDSRARMLMDLDTDLCRNISDALSPFYDCTLLDADYRLKRGELASLVFSNPQALRVLNSVVHPAVLRNLYQWRQQRGGILFVESAIPAESGLRDVVDEEWVVEAPEDLRIKRVEARSGLSPEQILARIEVQRSEWSHLHPVSHTIVNDGNHSVILRIHKLLKRN